MSNCAFAAAQCSQHVTVNVMLIIVDRKIGISVQSMKGVILGVNSILTHLTTWKKGTIMSFVPDAFEVPVSFQGPGLYLETTAVAHEFVKRFSILQVEIIRVSLLLLPCSP